MFRPLRPLLWSLCLCSALLTTHAPAAGNSANPRFTDRGLYRPLIIDRMPMRQREAGQNR